MSRTPKWLLVTSGCLIAFVAVAYIQGWLSGAPKRAPKAKASNLSDHPVYSKYDFGKDANVIDFGVQPMGVPIGVLSAVMERDTVLIKALSEQGLKIRFHPFLKGADVNFFLRRGDLEVALGGDMPAIAAAATSNVLIATLVKQGFSSFVTKKHMLIKDLRGKRIGYPFGSNAHYALLQTLSAAGLRETDVHLVRLNVNEMPDKLAEGHIDAFVAWEPFISIALARFDDFVVIHRSLSSSYMYFSRSLSNRHPETIRLIIASQLRAMAWMRSQAKNLLEACQWSLQARKVFLKKPQVLSMKLYAQMVKSDLLDIMRVPIILERDLAPEGRLFREFEFLKGLGKIPEAVDWINIRRCFDRTVISEVLSEKKKYKLDTFEWAIK